MKHKLLFTGHMLDAPGRKDARFPADKEDDVAAALLSWLQQKQSGTSVPLAGIAGGACGGDILFHEACRALGIPSEMYLALPVDDFIEASVAFAGPGWVERFNRLRQSLPVQVLTGRHDDDDVWDRANRWMLEAAQEESDGGMTLLALWDGKEGDGAGGTADMIRAAEEGGAATVILDPGGL